MTRYEEKRDWILDWIKNRGPVSYMQYACTFDDEFHDAFHDQFGTKLIVYTIGPNRCPDATRTLRRMWIEGELRRGTLRNQDAKAYCQPTYCYMYYLPDSNSGIDYETWYSRNWQQVNQRAAHRNGHRFRSKTLVRIFGKCKPAESTSS